MFGMRTRFLAAAALAASLCLASAGAASASGVQAQFQPNYTFSDGSKGFLLKSHGGDFDPGVLVSFNPPGDGSDGLLIALLNPADPMLVSTAAGGSFNFLIGLLLPAVMPGDGSVVPLPTAPDRDGVTGFHDMSSGHDISVGLQFRGPGAIDPTSWGAMAAPDGVPAGDFLGGVFQFSQLGDPSMTFHISVDGGAPLTFTLDDGGGVPEPAAWALLIAGFSGVGAVLRQRRRALALA